VLIAIAALCILLGLGVIGDIASSVYSSSSISIEESTELRKRCGPLGPSTAGFIDISKLKPSNSFWVGLGVCTSSKEDNVRSLCLPLEFTLNRGELLSSTSLSSKSVSNISVASDTGRGASAFMLKNASMGCPFWNISTRGSIGVCGE
jgi:hypothetical protein